jgi:pilus assembly protein Flp/PilA
MEMHRVGRRAVFARDERGQGLVEYALILSLVSLASISALGFLSGKINNLFSEIGNSLNSVSVGGGAGAGSGTDTTAPALVILTPAEGASSVSMNPTYSGTCGTAAGDLPTITITIVRVAGNPDSGSPYGPLTTTCSSGTWSVVHPGPGASQGLKNGRTYAATATQSDSSGNTTSDTNTFTT